MGGLDCLYLPTVAEFLPTENREFMMIASLVCSRIGIIFYVIFYSYVVGNSGDLNDYRYSMILSSLGTILFMIISIIVIKDSPRYLFSRNYASEALKVISEIIPNDMEKELDRDLLKKEANDFIFNNKIESNYSMLFTSKFLKTILLCSVIYFSSSINNIGNMYTLPLIFRNKYSTQLIWGIVFQQFMAIPGLISGAFIANNPSLGRKYAIFIGFLFALIISCFTLLIGDGFMATTGFINFFNIMAYLLIKVYVVEVFPTNLRIVALSFTLISGKFGDLLAQPLCDLLYNNLEYGPLILFMIASLLGGVASFILPYETSKQAIDHNY
jgi:hypothetical protein